ncbi:MAG: hypothetical protein ABR612_09890 [Chromatocurvus sp.]
MKRILIAALCVLGSASSVAECIAPLPRVMPGIPDGNSASAAVMAQAGDEVRRYVRGVEAYLDCRDSLHPLQHNYLVDKAEMLAADYNEELANFLGREEMLATK